jgi:hypothetical protein
VTALLIVLCVVAGFIAGRLSVSPLLLRAEQDVARCQRFTAVTIRVANSMQATVRDALDVCDAIEVCDASSPAVVIANILRRPVPDDIAMEVHALQQSVKR